MFHPPRELFPIFKGARPFACWVLNHITGLSPASPDGHTAVLTMVDPFSKWVEAHPLKSPSSDEVVWLFHTEVVCRFGKPALVRMDGGPEFSRAFVDYLTAYGIRHRRITPHHPQAAG